MKTFSLALLMLATLAGTQAQDTLWIGGGGNIPLTATAVTEAVDVSGSRDPCTALPSLPQAAYGTAGAMTGGMPVFCNGQHQFSEFPECYVWSSSFSNWTLLARTETNRRDASIFQITDNDFIVLGGFHINILRSSEIYTASTGTFASGPRLPYTLMNACSAKMNNTHFVITGGETTIVGGETTNDVAIYNALTQEFSVLDNKMTVARSGHICGVVDGSNGTDIVVAGGEDIDGNLLDSIEIYNVDSDTWRVSASVLAEPNEGAASNPLSSGTFIYSGGFTPDGGASNIYEYDIASESFSRRLEGIGGFFLGRGHHGSVVISDASLNMCNE